MRQRGYTFGHSCDFFFEHMCLYLSVLASLSLVSLLSNMKDLLRDTFLGKTLRLVSGKRLLRYPEESSSFIIPEVYKVNADSVPDTPADNKALNYARESKDEEIGLKGAEAFEMQNRADEKAGEYTIVDCKST